MAINENRGTRQQARIHAHPFAGVDLDGHETLPLSRSLSSAGRNLRRKFFLNLMISLTFMLISSGSVAAMLASTIRTFWNSSSPGGGMLARLLISDGSSKSKTDRRSTFRTLSIPSMDRPRLRLRKLEI